MKFHGSFQYSRVNSAVFSRSSSFNSPPLSPSNKLSHNFPLSRSPSAVYDPSKSFPNQKLEESDSLIIGNSQHDHSFIDDQMSHELSIQPSNSHQSLNYNQPYNQIHQHQQQEQQHPHPLLQHTLPLSFPINGEYHNQNIAFQTPIAQEDGLYGTLMGTLNILKDPVGCVDLIGKFIALIFSS